MYVRKVIRGLVAAGLAAALFFHALGVQVFAEEGRYVSIGSLEELVTGQYVLLSGGFAPGALQDDWLTAVQPEICADAVTDARGAVWSIRVEAGGVVLTDSTGASVAPTGDGSNGIVRGEGLWTVRCRDGLFSFHGVSGGEPVTLAANIYADNLFRAYRDSTVEAAPEVYPSLFRLYRLEADPEPTETTRPTEEPVPETTAPEETIPQTAPAQPQWDWELYFGRLHAHSAFSDGDTDAQTLYARAKEAGLDFYAVTDHSDAFDNDTQGAIGEDGTAVSAEWAAVKAAASDASKEGFVGLCGYEMSWPAARQLGHITTFGTPGWQSRDQESYKNDPDALTNYYEALTGVPGSVSVFSHPGEDYGDFQSFAHRGPEYDRAVSLLEIGGEEGFFGWDSYLLALERGWHVAPTVSRHSCDGTGTARTVVLAKELTEQDLYEAMTSCRVYASMDSDLRILYTLNGSIMGSVIPAGERAQISVALQDPTDQSIGTVEVIAGGRVLAAQTLAGPGGKLTFSLPGGQGWYLLRITQPDGDLAVTAPVWMETADDMGIEAFAADTLVPKRGQPLALTLSLYNQEAVEFLAETAVFSVDGQVIHAVNLSPIPGGGTDSYTFSYTHNGLGITEILATVTATVGAERRTYEKTLTLRFRLEDTVGHILVDGSHGAREAYDRLAELAAGANIAVTVADAITEPLLESAQLLVIPAGTEALEPEFLALAAEFVKNGGSLILCGGADARDTDLHWSAEGNKLLKSLGLSLRLQDDTAVDETNNGGSREHLAAARFQPDSDWSSGLAPEQIYWQKDGCTVTGGTWLVRGFDTTRSLDGDGDGLGGGTETVLLAVEESRWGGRVFVSGGDFLSDGMLPQQKNAWDPASANQSLLEKLLDIEKAVLPMSAISAARESPEGTAVRVRGYVTAGTSNSHNRFPGLLYLQDDTGGIAVTSFADEGLAVGTPLELIGVRAEQQGNPVLKLMEYRVLEEAAWRYAPGNSRHKEAMDYAANGGRLLQVQGVVKTVEYTADGKGVRRFALEDARGDLAEILIEDRIFSGATGKNELASEVKKGRTVRAIGILHLDAEGKPVLRVRNCDEVVYVPPNIIPRTGDAIGLPLAVMMLSGTALLMIKKKRKKPDC